MRSLPPFVGWYQGPQAIITLIHQQCPADEPGDMRLVPLTDRVATVVDWCGHFDADAADEGEVATTFTGLYESFIDGLAELNKS